MLPCRMQGEVGCGAKGCERVNLTIWQPKDGVFDNNHQESTVYVVLLPYSQVLQYLHV
jgi:hypothetical protein